MDMAERAKKGLKVKLWASAVNARAMGNKTKLTFKRMLSECETKTWKMLAFCLRLTRFSLCSLRLSFIIVSMIYSWKLPPRKILDLFSTKTTQDQQSRDELFPEGIKARICIHPFISLSYCFCSDSLSHRIHFVPLFPPRVVVHQHLHNHYFPLSVLNDRSEIKVG